MKKCTQLLALVAVAMMIASQAACSTTTSAPSQAAATSAAAQTTAAAQASATPAPTVDLVYYAPGSDEQDLPNVLAAVNEKMKTDGVGVNLIVKHLGWDVWSDRINVMLSTGEKFDMFQAMENWIPTGVYASRGGLASLNDLLDKYGAAIKQVTPDYCWDQITIGGKIYSIPAYWRDTTQLGSPVGSLECRQDLLDKYNIALPKTFEELVNAMVTIKEKEPDMKDAYFYDHNRGNSAAWLERTFDTFPFYSDFNNEIVCVREDGTVEPWISTPEFKQECDDYHLMYEKGLINPDILSVPDDVAIGNTSVAQGKLIISESGDYTTYLQKNPDAKVTNFMLAPDKPSYVTLPLWNSNAVPASSAHPEAAVKFINWLYSDQKNHDLFIYGKEGTDYTVVDQYRANFINDAKAGTPLYGSNFDWMIGNYKWLKLSATTSDSDVALQTTSAKSVKISIVAGFTFNSEPVKNEFANLQAAIPEAVNPMRFGVVDYASNYDAALAKLKAAGLDTVIAEYKKQFDAWKATKTK
jgi:putative aldouronate transport system substrate-binding protein